MNKELRAIKRVLNVAVRWKYSKETPAIEFIREPKLEPTFVSSSDSVPSIRPATSQPTRQDNITAQRTGGEPSLFLYMTGWRASVGAIGTTP